MVRYTTQPERVKFDTAFEERAQAVSSVHVKPANQTPLKSLLTLSAIRVLVAGLVVVTLIPNLILGAIFCARCLFAELCEYWRAAVFGRRLRIYRRKRGTHIAGALGSLPHLPQQLALTISRPPQGRSQWNVCTAVEKPAQRASLVNVTAIFADRARLVSSSLNCALVAGLILLALNPNIVLGGIFWLGAVNVSWSTFPTHTADVKTVAPQSVVPAPVLSSPPTDASIVGGDESTGAGTTDWGATVLTSAVCVGNVDHETLTAPSQKIPPSTMFGFSARRMRPATNAQLRDEDTSRARSAKMAVTLTNDARCAGFSTAVQTFH